MSITTYFVRHNGKVRGPFAPDHVHRLVASGLVDRAAEVSTDRSGWLTLTAHPDFGGPAPSAATPAPAAVNDNYELDLSGLLTPAVATGDGQSGTGSDWFESIDLGKMGDV